MVHVRRELPDKKEGSFFYKKASDEWRVKKPKKQKAGEAEKKIGH
jgi:hypothetical protein